MSLGVGMVDVVGGNAKSYYIAKDSEPAFRIKKKNYKNEFIPLWGNCPEVINGFTDQKWSDLVKHITVFSECSNLTSTE